MYENIMTTLSEREYLSLYKPVAPQLGCYENPFAILLTITEEILVKLQLINFVDERKMLSRDFEQLFVDGRVIKHTDNIYYLVSPHTVHVIILEH